MNMFELGFAAENTRQPIPRLGLLLLLKSFQKLGYFVRIAESRLLLSCTSRRPSVGTRYRAAIDLVANVDHETAYIQLFCDGVECEFKKGIALISRPHHQTCGCKIIQSAASVGKPSRR